MAPVNEAQAQGRSLLEQMVTAQPDPLPRQMRAAGYDAFEAEDLGLESLTRALRSRPTCAARWSEPWSTAGWTASPPT